MKTQKEFIEAVIGGKTLKCGTTKIYSNGLQIVVSGDGFATTGNSFKSSNDENFVHLMNYLGVSVMALYIEDWVVA